MQSALAVTQVWSRSTSLKLGRAIIPIRAWLFAWYCIGWVWSDLLIGAGGTAEGSWHCPYLSTNHHRRTMPTRSADSTKAHTRAMVSSSFVFL